MKLFSLAVLLLFASCTKNATSLTEQIESKKASSKAPAEVKKEFKRAIKELKTSGIEEASLQTNVRAPNFNFNNTSLYEELESGPIVVKFFRGSWCPYCLLEIQDYEKYYESIKKKGYRLIFFTPDNENEVKKLVKKYQLSFPVYSDKDNAIAKKFGIAYKLDEKVEKIYQKFGIDLDTSHGNTDKELPMPGTYVIQKSGMITFAFSDADYTKRVDPIELLKEL